MSIHTLCFEQKYEKKKKHTKKKKKKNREYANHENVPI